MWEKNYLSQWGQKLNISDRKYLDQWECKLNILDPALDFNEVLCTVLELDQDMDSGPIRFTQN